MKTLYIDFVRKSVIWQIEDVSNFHFPFLYFTKKLLGESPS